jgi:NAD(P)-dependent dehydrogenase (short-subunit alcohol dehydrogenase family)
MHEFNEKVAVVTGAASGIGAALARRFASEGMKLVLADIDTEGLEGVADALRSGGTQVLTVSCDVSDAAAVEALADATVAEFGQIDLVCNNAGVGSGGLMEGLTVKDWQWTLGVNLWGVINGMITFLPRLIAQGSGHIVNTASAAGLISAPFMGPYAVSKFGVVAMSEATYHELAMSGSDVGISVLCPAWVSTRIHESDRSRPDHLRNELSGTPDEQAAGIAEVMRAVIEAGMDADDVAAQVVDAVRADRFYILTHPDVKELVRRRTEAILNDEPPPFAMP